MILFWIFYRKVSQKYDRGIMPVGVAYLREDQGEDIPTLGGSVPHGVGGIRGQYFTNYKSVF